MRPDRCWEAYHIERTLVACQGIAPYPCGCQRCHGFRIQSIRTIECHHWRHGRDEHLMEPLLVNGKQS